MLRSKTSKGFVVVTEKRVIFCDTGVIICIDLRYEKFSVGSKKLW